VTRDATVLAALATAIAVHRRSAKISLPAQTRTCHSMVCQVKLFWYRERGDGQAFLAPT